MTPEQSTLVELASEAIYDFLDERFPEGAMPGGIQLFADDHLDAEFKHEAGCDALAERVVSALLERLSSTEDGVTEEMLSAAAEAAGCPLSGKVGPRNREIFTAIYLAMLKARIGL